MDRHRLRVVEIAVPPLRERIEDLPILAEHLVRKTSEELHRGPPVLSEDILAVMERHPWPGNVRELANVMEYVAVVSKGDVARLQQHAAGTGEPGHEQPFTAEHHPAAAGHALDVVVDRLGDLDELVDAVGQAHQLGCGCTEPLNIGRIVLKRWTGSPMFARTQVDAGCVGLDSLK